MHYYAFSFRVRSHFFSNLFLFDGEADSRWLKECTDGATLEARWPVFAFNSGLIGARGLEDELRSLRAPLLVLSGSADKRVARRSGYAEGEGACRLQTLEGTCNVLPWEDPAASAAAVQAFAAELA